MGENEGRDPFGQPLLLVPRTAEGKAIPERRGDGRAEATDPHLDAQRRVSEGLAQLSVPRSRITRHLLCGGSPWNYEEAEAYPQKFTVQTALP